jgi:hypothetical protein
MVWFKVDDSFYDHPKAEDLSDSAVALWTRAGSYCARHLTDGFVSHRKAARMCDNPESAISELVAAGLWEKDADGYRFHDWHEYQPTREESLAAAKGRSIGGAVGNHRRWHAERGILDRNCRYCLADPHRSADRSSDRLADQSTESLPNPPSRPDPTRTTEEHPSDVLFGGFVAEPAKPKKRTQPATRIPDDFTVTKAMVAWAGEETPLVNGKRETDQFIDYWKAADGRTARKKDWVAAWRTWMRKAQTDAEARQARVPVQQARQTGLPAGYEPRGTIAHSDRQGPSRESAQARKFREWNEIGAELDRQYAENGGRL